MSTVASSLVVSRRGIRRARWCAAALPVGAFAALFLPPAAARAQDTTRVNSKVCFDGQVGMAVPVDRPNLTASHSSAFGLTASFRASRHLAIDAVLSQRTLHYQGLSFDTPTVHYDGLRDVGLWGVGPALRWSLPLRNGRPFVQMGLEFVYTRMEVSWQGTGIDNFPDSGRFGESAFGIAPMFGFGVEARAWKHGFVVARGERLWLNASYPTLSPESAPIAGWAWLGGIGFGSWHP